MAQFTTSRLVGSRAIVAGTDVNGVTNQLVVDTTQWDEVNADQAYDTAKESFEAAVEEFFAPLVEAAEHLDTALNKPDVDPATFVVLKEKVEGTQGQDEVLVQLTHDSIVLRLVEAGEHDRLVWVGDNLEVTVASATTSQAPEPELTGFDS